MINRRQTWFFFALEIGIKNNITRLDYSHFKLQRRVVLKASVG